ncbi:MAG: MarR family transcriptional regulator [Maricaulaceae bacterium]
MSAPYPKRVHSSRGYNTPPSRMNNRDALALWHRVTLETVLSETPDLTTRQLALMTTVYLEVGPHTVRSLAEALNVTKAVITRALDTLESYHFVERGPDYRDKRSIIIKRTARGSTYLTQFAETIRQHSKLGQIAPVAA